MTCNFEMSLSHKNPTSSGSTQELNSKNNVNNVNTMCYIGTTDNFLEHLFNLRWTYPRGVYANDKHGSRVLWLKNWDPRKNKRKGATTNRKEWLHKFLKTVYIMKMNYTKLTTYWICQFEKLLNFHQIRSNYNLAWTL